MRNLLLVDSPERRQKVRKRVFIHLPEQIDHENDLPPTPSPASAEKDCEYVFDAGKVRRLSLLGVKLWSDYFAKLSNSGTRFLFVDCSPVVVNCANFITDFLDSGKVISIQLPFHCRRCSRTLIRTCVVSELPKDLSMISPVPCSGCATLAEFDETPSHYFSFLNPHRRAL